VALHPAIPQYLNVLFPRANGASLGGGAAEYLFSGTQPTDEHFYQGRLDHRLSSTDSLFVRVTYDRAAVDRIPPDKPPISLIIERTRNTYVTAEHQHTTSQVGGIVNFANLQSFLQGRAISVDFAVPGKIDPDRRYRQALIGAFVQDDVRLWPRLSANLGLRYEFVTVPTEADGKISN